MENQNNLLPIFLKHDNLKYLIIGAGEIAFEKLDTILVNSPNAIIKIVAKKIIKKEILQIVKANSNINIEIKNYEANDLNEFKIVFAAVNDIEIIKQIRKDTLLKNVILNAADKPEFCDFYLGSVVIKNSLKIAISTNGKSPTIAKRIKETLNDSLPNDLENLLNQMNKIRENLKTDFKQKVKTLNEITKSWSK